MVVVGLAAVVLRPAATVQATPTPLQVSVGWTAARVSAIGINGDGFTLSGGAATSLSENRHVSHFPIFGRKHIKLGAWAATYPSR